MFSFNRYVNLVVDDLRTDAKSQLVQLLATIGVVGAIVAFTAYNHRYFYTYLDHYGNELDYMIPSEIGIFSIAIMIIGAMCGANMFNTLKNKTSRISYLTRPASDMEKYASRFTIFIVLFPIIMLMGLEAIDILRNILTRLLVTDLVPGRVQFLTPSDLHDWQVVVVFASAYFSTQSLFALGSTIWPKRAAVYTFLSLVVLTIAMSIWGAVLTDIFFSSDKTYGWDNTYDKETVGNFWTAAFAAFSFLTCLINYTVAYFRFKEIEIIQRW